MNYLNLDLYIKYSFDEKWAHLAFKYNSEFLGECDYPGFRVHFEHQNNIFTHIGEDFHYGFSCPQYFYSKGDSIVRKTNEIKNYLNGIIVGEHFNEIRSKIRKYFGCFEGIPEKYNNTNASGTITYAGYNVPWGDTKYEGTCQIISQKDTYMKNRNFFRTYTIQFTHNIPNHDDIELKILCIPFNSYAFAKDYFGNYIPIHFRLGEVWYPEIENFIVNEINENRYSSYNELLVKIATFAYNINIDHLSSIPISKGEIKKLNVTIDDNELLKIKNII